MNHFIKLFIAIAIVGAFLTMPLLTPMPAYADKLTDAIAKTPVGTEKGQIDPKAQTGYLGIPGAPNINPFLAFFWAVWVGWIFSTVGAFGGVMAGVGHITIFKLTPTPVNSRIPLLR